MMSEGLKSNSTLTTLNLGGVEKEEREIEWIKKEKNTNKNGKW